MTLRIIVASPIKNTSISSLRCGGLKFTLNANSIRSIIAPTIATVPASPLPNDTSGFSTASTASLPAVYSPNVTALVNALTKVCGYCSPAGEAPTFTVIEVGVVEIICNFFSYAGSESGELVTDTFRG